jgi:hypothetical protein
VAEKTTFARALKMAESGSFEGDYGKVQGLVRGSARLLGAYAFPSDQWNQMAEDAGVPGARWRDQRAQDYVAKRTFDRLYAKYGDWRLVATAWKAGEEVADAIAADPTLLSHKTLKPLRGFIEQVMKYAKEDVGVNRPTRPDGTPVPVEMFPTDTASLSPSQQFGGPPTSAPGEALRQRLRAMRDARREQGLMEQEAEIEEPV